jgi:hypothetical protein
MALYSRRRLLGGLGLVTVGTLAGCSSIAADDESTDGNATESTDGSRSTELNLQEANVVDVELTDQETATEFAVTLHHDDDGEDGYANWWQVETLDGSELGRRDLSHPHSSEPFTRAEPIEVPDDVDCVIVRGHDQTHGYGGQAMLVTLESGTTEGVDQGPEPDSFEGVDCP